MGVKQRKGRNGRIRHPSKYALRILPLLQKSGPLPVSQIYKRLGARTAEEQDSCYKGILTCSFAGVIKQRWGDKYDYELKLWKCDSIYSLAPLSEEEEDEYQRERAERIKEAKRKRGKQGGDDDQEVPVLQRDSSSGGRRKRRNRKSDPDRVRKVRRKNKKLHD